MDAQTRLLLSNIDHLNWVHMHLHNLLPRSGHLHEDTHDANCIQQQLTVGLRYFYNVLISEITGSGLGSWYMYLLLHICKSPDKSIGRYALYKLWGTPFTLTGCGVTRMWLWIKRVAASVNFSTLGDPRSKQQCIQHPVSLVVCMVGMVEYMGQPVVKCGYSTSTSQTDPHFIRSKI